jgi:hypothetical protein
MKIASVFFGIATAGGTERNDRVPRHGSSSKWRCEKLRISAEAKKEC